jgi:dipeptidyl-peptidase-4
MSHDAAYYFDTYSNIHTLPALRLHAADGTLKTTIAAARPELLPPDLQYPELMTIPAADGFPMPAQILKPKGFDPARRYPVILHCYGGPSAPTVKDEWQNETLFDNVLASKGYIAVAIDNRAATAISKTLENSLAAGPGAGETADLVAGIRWLKAQPWVDGGRVGVWGWSGGGTITLNLMTRSQEFKAGIAGAPVTDWRFYDSKWGESLLKLPQNNPAAYDAASLIPRARDLHGSLMMIYGTDDDNVHPQNEEAFINALIAAGKPYQVELFPMRKHGFVDMPALIERYNAMLAFWEKNL